VEQQTLRQKECQHRIESLRTGLLNIRHALLTAVEAHENPQFPREEDQRGAAVPETSPTECVSPAHTKSLPQTTEATESVLSVGVLHYHSEEKGEPSLTKELDANVEENEEIEEIEENQHARGAAESLLLGSNENMNHSQDEHADDSLHLMPEEASDEEDGVANESLRASLPGDFLQAEEQAEQQFAQVMSTLDRYGARITHTQDDVAQSTEIESGDYEENQDRDASPVQDLVSRDTASQEQNHNDSVISPQKDIDSSPDPHYLPREDFSDPTTTEVEKTEEVEVSRMLFPHDDNIQDDGERIREHEERATTTLLAEPSDLQENVSSLLPPPAMSAESPHVVHHLDGNVSNIPGNMDNGIGTDSVPHDGHHSNVRDQQAMAEPLSCSVVADLMSSVGDESQSVDFSHYLHRAYEVKFVFFCVHDRFFRL